jgi:hypothetical protein
MRASQKTLSGYVRYYHNSRTHLGLGKQCPFPQQALSDGKIVAIPQLGGLQHRYDGLQHGSLYPGPLLANDRLNRGRARFRLSA